MKKNILQIIIILLFSFVFIENINATNSKKYSKDSIEVTINKDNAEVNEFGTVQIYVGYLNFSIVEYLASEDTPVYMYTTVDDLAYREKDLWWETLYYCTAIDLGFGTVGSQSVAAIYTDSMASNIAGDVNSFLGMFGEKQKCVTLAVEGVSDENKISYCSKYEELFVELNSLVKNYQKEKKTMYKAEFNEKLDYLKSLCKTGLSSADHTDPCVSRCLHLNEDLKIWNETMNPIASEGECGFSGRLLFWFKNILKWIKYILPVIVIVLGILDFIKSIGSDKDDEMKKAQGRFVKRLIAAALVFIVPLIIEFVLDKMGFTQYIEGCGIIDL